MVVTYLLTLIVRTVLVQMKKSGNAVIKIICERLIIKARCALYVYE